MDRLNAKPDNLLKRFLPRTLFGRWLIMLLAPVILLQVIATYIFYNNHWDKVTRRLALGLAGEISSLIELRDTFPEHWQNGIFAGVAFRNMQIEVGFRPNEKLPPIGQAIRPFSILDAKLTQALGEKIRLPYQIDTERDDRVIKVLVQLPDGLMEVSTNEERLFSNTTYVFIIWMVSASIVLLFIAILFLRNQVRPIRRLAAAAEAFGRGQEVPFFHPSGAAEIRQASAAFLEMKERITRQIAERTEMLAGVSHDLRTPLTRMKLQLALLGQKPEIADLQRDISEMEKMISGYLAFARGEDGELARPTDIADLLQEIVEDTARRGRTITCDLPKSMIVPVKPMAIKRCLTNIVENALRYGKNVSMALEAEDQAVTIMIDDDGPGIPPQRRDEVFLPFRRLDASRNPGTGGVGLGLSIARDIVSGHGGTIELDTSPRGGLRVMITLPQ